MTVDDLKVGLRHRATIRVEISHNAATPIGMAVRAEFELVEIDDRRLRFMRPSRSATAFTSA